MKSCCRLLVLLAFALLPSCKEKRSISLSGEQPVSPPDFISFFEPMNLPVSLPDSVLTKKIGDSLRVSYAVLKAVLPDSIGKQIAGITRKTTFHALGKVQVPKAESYVLLRASSPSSRFLLLLAFDNKYQFVAAMPVLEPLAKKSVRQSLVIDRKYLINVIKQRVNADASVSEGKDVFVLNEAAKRFMLIMTESLEDKVFELINPIDTLSAIHRFAADYENGKMNLISVRDGRKPDRVSFFAHFEKKNGACIGELKGEAFWKSPTRAEYRQGGDPCVLQFTFSKTSVHLKEQNCGSHRGPDCLFDGSFARKKAPRIKKKP